MIGTSTHALRKVVQVAVGVVKNARGEVLISLRDETMHQGGLWEFPGGKIEAGETPEQALLRELEEELDIHVNVAAPLITVKHQYPDLAVQLQAFLVESFSGEPKSCLGQPLQWTVPAELARYPFPAANLPIIAAVQLPGCYAILDAADERTLFLNLQKILAKGVTLIQARLKNMTEEAVQSFVSQAYPLCRRQGAFLLLNSAAVNGYGLAVDGVHLTSSHLTAIDRRPENVRWLAASCHNLEQLQHAQRIGADFAVLAPVLPTRTHPGAEPLGWQAFAEWVAEVNLPVYALGGMAITDLALARRSGGQGIAAISAFIA